MSDQKFMSQDYVDKINEIPNELISDYEEKTFLGGWEESYRATFSDKSYLDIRIVKDTDEFWTYIDVCNSEGKHIDSYVY